MKVLVTGDWHADKSTAGVDRFDDVRDAALQTVDAAIAEGVDLWAFLGDLTDPDDGPRALRAVTLAIECSERLTAAGILNIWIAGNHDVIEDGSGRTTLAPLKALDSKGNSRVYEVPACRTGEDTGDVALVMLPYPPASRSFDLSKDFAACISGIKCRTGLVLAHATNIPGAVEGEETFEMPRGRGVSLPLGIIPNGWTIANGHYHSPQVTPSGVLIPGALQRLTRGEARNEPRYLLVDV